MSRHARQRRQKRGRTDDGKVRVRLRDFLVDEVGVVRDRVEAVVAGRWRGSVRPGDSMAREVRCPRVPQLPANGSPVLLERAHCAGEDELWGALLTHKGVQ